MSKWNTTHSMPVAAGIVLRERPQVAWLETHSENLFAAGGGLHATMAQIRADYPLSLHGVGLSLGSADQLDDKHLRRLRELVDRYQPELVSEHLCAGAQSADATAMICCPCPSPRKR